MASRASQRGKSWAAENLLATAIALYIPRHQGANREETQTLLDAPRTVDLIDVRCYFHMIDPVSFSAGATEDLEIARVIKLFSLVRREPVSQKPRASLAFSLADFRYNSRTALIREEAPAIRDRRTPNIGHQANLTADQTREE